jgi:hypothetical protein
VDYADGFAENFPQAVEDYTSALKVFTRCMPITTREIASSHYKLAIVLESLSDRKQEAIENVEKAIQSVQARKAAIERGQDPDHLEDSHDVGGHNLRALSKGKGKAQANDNYKTSVLTMEERKKQVDDCEEQLTDLQAKVCSTVSSWFCADGRSSTTSKRHQRGKESSRTRSHTFSATPQQPVVRQAWRSRRQQPRSTI